MKKQSKSINQLRAGVIGTGFIGPVHIEALRRLGVQVAALCDVPALAETMAAKHAIPHAFTDYRKLLESPEIDVVHITVPNRFHREMSVAALEAGKHCICEKPLAMDTTETAQIIKLAKSSGTVFAVNYNVRFYPAVLQLRKMVANDEMGKIIHVNGSYMQDWLYKETDYNWRLLPAEGGKLRAVADIGTHWMDTASFILGAKIDSVFANLATYHKTRKRPLGEVQTFSKANAAMKFATYDVKTEDFASVLLQFSNGAHGNLAVSQVAAGRKNCLRIEVYGSKKSAWWCSEERRCCILEIATRPIKRQSARRPVLEMAPRDLWIIHPATLKDFQTHSKCFSVPSMGGLPRERKKRLYTQRLKTGIRKSPFARRS
jgi:predicted dehydrogenase